MQSEPFTALKDLSGPILVTGHTGFKGTWLMLMLERLGVKAVGFSLPAEPGSLFEQIGHRINSPSVIGDIRDLTQIQNVLIEHSPAAVIHLAAQPLVLESYKLPLETFETNVMGTANLLQASRICKTIRAIVISTTDKVYDNNNSGFPFKETDPLKGKDPYSASKVGTESVISAWQHISMLENGPSIIAARAGNVIGGGDFSKDRIIPDIIRAITKNENPILRNPKSVRPWQHVLDPLSGYLMALQHALVEKSFDALNFGPLEIGLSVEDLAKLVIKEWNLDKMEAVNNVNNEKYEAEVLNLDSTKAMKILGWNPVWNQQEAIAVTSLWWKHVIVEKRDSYETTLADIDNYLKKISLSISLPVI